MATTLTRVSSQPRVRVGVVASTGLAALAVTACLAAMAMITAGSAWDVPGLLNIPVDLAVGLSFPVVGAVVLRGRRGSRRLGWLLVGAGAAAALASLGGAAAGTATDADAVARAAVVLHAVAWVPGFMPLLTLVPLLYPDGRLPGPRWRYVAWLAVVGMALQTIGSGLFTGPFEGTVVTAGPLSDTGAAAALGVLVTVLVLPAVLASFAGLVVRLRRSAGMERRQVATLLAAFSLLLLQVLLQPLLPPDLRALTQAGVVVLLPIAIGVSITRHRLFDLDLAICRALVGASLALTLAGAFVTLFLVLRALLPSQTVVASAVAAGVTGLLVQPLATRLTAGADRMMYGDRADPYAVLTGFSRRLQGGLGLDEVGPVICETVLSSLRLTSASLEVATDSGLRGTALAGQPTGAPESFDLRHHGRLVGRLTVTPRAGEQVLPARDRELLEAIADHVAPVVSSVRAFEELRSSREAIVTGREEERRRLRHDLHDGVGAALAGVRLQLESARALVTEPVAVRLLDAAGAGVAQAVDDVRTMTDDLRPAALDELGLGATLRGLAERVEAPGRAVAVQLAELPPLPAAVEVACLRVAAEALNNAVRHSGGSHFAVRLDVEPDALVLTVSDDGHGMVGSAPAAGVGLESMRQRVEEIGGRLSVSSSPDGTTVRATLPLELG